MTKWYPAININDYKDFPDDIVLRYTEFSEPIDLEKIPNKITVEHRNLFKKERSTSSTLRSIRDKSIISDMDRAIREVNKKKSRPEIEKLEEDFATYFTAYNLAIVSLEFIASELKKDGIDASKYNLYRAAPEIIQTPWSDIARNHYDKTCSNWVFVKSEQINEKQTKITIDSIGKYSKDDYFAKFEYIYDIQIHKAGKGPYGDWFRDLCNKVSDLIEKETGVRYKYRASEHQSYIDRQPNKRFVLYTVYE